MSKKAKGKKKPAGAKGSSKQPVQDTRLPFEARGGWLAAAVLALLVAVFFYPIVFQGETAVAPDRLSSYANKTLSNSAFDEPGGFLEVYPLWTPYIFSGMPSFGSMITAPYTNPLAMALRFIPWRVQLVVFYFLIGLFSWLFLRRHGLGHVPALFGAVSFVFCAQVITLIMFSHNSKIVTLVYMPLILAGVVALWKRMDLLWAAVLALGVAWMLLAHHVQVSYYVLMAAGIFLIVSSVAVLREGVSLVSVVGRWVRVVLAMAVGLMTSMLLYLPVQEYAKYSIRGGADGGLTYEYATSWSLHPLEMVTFFVPSFMGFGGATYWGWMPFTDFPLYMGILPLFLAVAAVVLWPRERFHVFLWVTGLFALIVAFGNHLPVLYNPMFKFLPFFNKFRVPVMITFLLQFSVAMLAAIALDRLMRLKWEPALRRKLIITGGVFLAVLVFLGVLSSGLLQDTIRDRLVQRPALVQEVPAGQLPTAAQRLAEDAVDMARTDFARVLLIFGVGLALVWARLNGRVNNAVLGSGLLLLTVIDLWFVGLKPADYRPEQDLQAKFRTTPTVEYLQGRQEAGELFRILPLETPDGNPNFYAYFEISSITGYHPAKLEIYQEMIDDQGPVGLFRQIQAANFNVIDMLNARYLVCSPRTAQALENMNAERFVVRRRHPEALVENRGARPRAWFVDRYSVTEDEATHLRRLADASWNPAEEAILFAEVGQVDPAQGASVDITEHRPRQITATVDSPGRCLLVLSEVYFPKGWKYTLDGEPLEEIRANYALRAFVIPEGSHTLRARFDPQSFYTGIWMGAVGTGLIFVGLIGGGVLARKRLQLRTTEA